MHITINSMARLRTKDVNPEAVKSELTINRTTFSGDVEKIKLYEEDEEFLVVPRRWAQLKFGKTAQFHFHTERPPANWPKFVGDYWEGQQGAIDSVIAQFRDNKNMLGGLLKSDPGTGKTIMGLSVASLLNTRTLIVVPKTDLANQWRVTALGDADLEKEPHFPGIKFGHVQGKKREWEGCDAVTATVQTLYSQMDTLPEAFWSNFGLIIYDEGHRFPAKTFEKVLRKGNSRFRLGVSATWRRKDGMECAWQYHVGKVIHETHIKRKTGKFCMLPWNTHLSDGKFMFNGVWPPSRAAWLNAIAADQGYNRYLVKLIIRSAGKGRQTLVCSDRVEQLKFIKDELEKSFEPLTSSLYIGGMKKAELLEAKKADCILATYQMMSEGTDIETLDTLLLGTLRADVEQTVGRIQRPKEKKPLLVLVPYFETQWNERLATKVRKQLEEIGFKYHDVRVKAC